jgi:hypothetical protein
MIVPRVPPPGMAMSPPDSPVGGGMTINAPITVSGPMSPSQARQTGLQIGAALRSQIAMASKKGA